MHGERLKYFIPGTSSLLPAFQYIPGKEEAGGVSGKNIFAGKMKEERNNLQNSP
jgi:hypothetical protein